MKYIVYICALFFMIESCKTEEIMKFDVDSSDACSIRFVTESMGVDLSGANILDENDTLVTTSFVVRKSTYTLDTINLLVNTSGPTKNYDRHFNVEQVVEYNEMKYIYDSYGNVIDSVIDAVSGVHFKPLTDEYTKQKMYIKAGETKAYLPIILIRHTDLQLRPYRLKIKLVPNEEFNTDFNEQSNIRVVYFSDIPVKPNYWDRDAQYFYGKYSAVKLRFMVDHCDINLAGNALLDYGAADFSYYQKRLQKALMEYNATLPLGEFLTDENGRMVIFQYEWM